MEQKIYEVAVQQFAAFHNDWNCSAEAAATRLTQKVMEIVYLKEDGKCPYNQQVCIQKTCRGCMVHEQVLTSNYAKQAAAYIEGVKTETFRMMDTEQETEDGTRS